MRKDISETAEPSVSRAAHLDALLTEFEFYITSPPSWTNQRMKEYRKRFNEFGVWGLTADDLIDAAKHRIVALTQAALPLPEFRPSPASSEEGDEA